MSRNIVIGIDTSNYTTSVALLDESGELIANLKRPLPVKAGERGLRQSDALFAHTINIPDLMAEAEQYINLEQIKQSMENYKTVEVKQNTSHKQTKSTNTDLSNKIDKLKTGLNKKIYVNLAKIFNNIHKLKEEVMAWTEEMIENQFLNCP